MPPSAIARPSSSRTIARLIVGVVLIGLLVVAMAATALHHSRGLYRERALTATQNLAQLIERDFTATLDKVDLAILSVRDEAESDDRLHAEVAAQHAHQPGLGSVGVAGADGTVKHRVPALPGARIHIADREYFVRARDEKQAGLVISRPFVDPDSGRWTIAAARRIDHPDGSFAGVAYATIYTDQFEKDLAALDLGPYGAATLRNQDLQLIARASKQATGSSPVGNSTVSREFQEALKANPTFGAYVAATSLDKIERANTYRRTAKYHFYVLVGLATSDYLSIWQKEAAKTSVLVTTFGLITALLTWMIASAWRRREADAERILELSRAALRKSEDQLQLALEGAEMGVWSFDPGTGDFEANAQARLLYGLPADGPLTGEGALASLLPEDRERARAARDEAIRSGTPQDLEVRVSRPDGSQLWVHSRGRLEPGANGQASRLVGLVHDVTRRKQAEEVLHRSRQGLSRLAEASQRVMRETDLQGMLQAISEAALALTDARLATCGHGDVAGRSVVGGSARVPGAPACPPGEMFLVDRGGVHLELVEGADVLRLTDAELRAHPRRVGAPDGHVPLRGLLGARMTDREGQTNGLILVTDKAHGEFTHEDESLLRQLATIASLALQHVQARIALEASDRSKSEFLAMLSHELRNPLAPIRNSLYVLDRAAPGGEQARRAQTVIERQVVHLTQLVDDLLDVTRIARGKVQLRREQLHLGKVLVQAIDDHRSAFAQAGLQLHVAVPEAPLWIDGDRTRILQVIGNLLTNSAKFTDPGGAVFLSLTANESLRQAVVRVRDTGVGIAPDMLLRVFEPFAQAETTLARSKGGLGLGLALVKGLVEMHGGSVTVESEGLGKGTEFVLRFPLDASAAAADVPSRGSLELRPQRILVIDDNVDAAESLREVLELSGHTVVVAYSGSSGIDEARAFRPDAVLCDIGLPVLDGYQVAQAMRADRALRGVRLVALTGYAGPEDMARSLEAGFDAHIAKPLDLEKLRAALEGRGLPPRAAAD